MIDFVFTIDYEIYGNGTGSLHELVYQPARRLKLLFDQYGAKFMPFVEVAEFEKIEAQGTDSAIDLVKQQIAEFHRDGFEIGLHLHPQWANARFEKGKWILDSSEYNLCTLSRARIVEIVDSSLAYLRYVIDASGFTPLSFRAGNWLFQPTATAANVLAERGIRIDSSVFKGGLQRRYQLDYRPSLKNGYFWPFRSDVNRSDAAGPWIEVPIHTEMVLAWRMATSKRMAYKNQFGMNSQSTQQKLVRGLDFLRLKYPLKLDFCRMTLNEMLSVMEKVIRQDREDPETYRPIISIGHTKDLTDFQTVDSFLAFLKGRSIPITTFAGSYPKLSAGLTS